MTTKTVIRKQFNDLTVNTETADNIQVLNFDESGACVCNLDATEQQAWGAEIEAANAGMQPSCEWNHNAERNTLIIIATWQF